MNLKIKASDIVQDKEYHILGFEDSDLQINLVEIGIMVGKSIILRHKAPLHGAIAFEVDGNMVCMRPSEAELIITEPLDSAI
ncbi:FeoA family protein [Arthrospiribacter ruber]|uniref:Ferrous iron transport protein A n=1 Tax=Arthrospiribacter ruber TaxID=2487934 RepID=A0A951MF03_9BACT|nr:FeoA family protein [Arthrospiribacter ruber]MBW3469557.1 ferrous iron transport protein A [Arthrospiribacter ruber]